MNLGISDPWEGIIMKVGDLVTLLTRKWQIGVVTDVRKPLEKGGRWYYYVEWFNGEMDSCYCSSGTLDRLT